MESDNITTSVCSVLESSRYSVCLRAARAAIEIGPQKCRALFSRRIENSSSLVTMNEMKMNEPALIGSFVFTCGGAKHCPTETHLLRRDGPARAHQ
jgi:hypothetical protein